MKQYGIDLGPVYMPLSVGQEILLKPLISQSQVGAWTSMQFSDS